MCVWACAEVSGPVGGEEIPLLFPRKPSVRFVHLLKETQRRCKRKDECATDSIKQTERESNGRNLASLSPTEDVYTGVVQRFGAQVMVFNQKMLSRVGSAAALQICATHSSIRRCLEVRVHTNI